MGKPLRGFWSQSLRSGFGFAQFLFDDLDGLEIEVNFPLSELTALASNTIKFIGFKADSRISHNPYGGSVAIQSKKHGFGGQAAIGEPLRQLWVCRRPHPAGSKKQMASAAGLADERHSSECWRCSPTKLSAGNCRRKSRLSAADARSQSS